MKRDFYRIRDFFGGQVTDKDFLSPREVVKGLNVILGPNGVLETRKGRQKYNSSEMAAGKKIDGLWTATKSDGTERIYAACNGKLYFSTGDGSFSEVTYSGGATPDVTYTAGTEWGFVTYNDVVYGFNGLDPVTTEGTHSSDRVVVIAIGSETGATGLTAEWPAAVKYAVLHQERIFAVTVGDPNFVRHSLARNAEDWTGDDDGNAYHIGLNDGEVVTGLISYRSGLLIGKPHSLYYLSTLITQSETASDMDTTLSWDIDQVTGKGNDHGVLYHRSLALWEGGVIFHTWDGIGFYNGRDVDIISKQEIALSEAQQNDRSKHTTLKTLGEDWRGGTGGGFVKTEGLGYTSFPGRLSQQLVSGYNSKNGSWDLVGTLSGTKINDNWFNSGQTYLTFDTVVDNFDKANNVSAVNPTWARANGSWQNTNQTNGESVVVHGGANTNAIGNTYTSTSQGAGSSDGYWGVTVNYGWMRFAGSDNTNERTGSFLGIILTDTSNDGYRIGLVRNGAGRLGIHIQEVDNLVPKPLGFGAVGFTHTANTKYEIQVKRNGSTLEVKIDGTIVITSRTIGSFTNNFARIHLISDFTNGRFFNVWEDTTEDAGTSTYTADVVDYGLDFVDDISDGDYRTGHLSYNAHVPSGSSLTWEVRASSASEADVANQTWRALGIGGNIDISTSFTMARWFQWRVSLVNSSGTNFDQPRIYGVAVGANWYSPVIDLASAPSQWGNFLVDASNNDVNGSISYFMRTDSDSTLTDQAWVSIQPNDNLQALTVNRYFQIKIELDTIKTTENTYIGSYVKDMSENDEVDVDGDGTMPYVQSWNVDNYTGTAAETSAGWVKGRRYYLAIAEDGSERNTVMYVCEPIFFRDKSGDKVVPILKFDQMRANCFAEYKNRTLMGDTKFGTVWFFEEGNRDDNRIITSEIITGDIDVDLPEFKKVFRVANITAHSSSNYRFASSVDGRGWNEVEIPGKDKMYTYRRVLKGYNTGGEAKFRIRPGIENFQDRPVGWQASATDASAYWDDTNKWLYSSVAISGGQHARFIRQLNKPLNPDTDDMAFWIMGFPATTPASSGIQIGFCNPATNLTNNADFIGLNYNVTGTPTYKPIAVFRDANNNTNQGDNGDFTMTAGQDWFIDIKYTADNNMISIKIYDFTLTEKHSINFINPSYSIQTHNKMTHFGIWSALSGVAQTWYFKTLATYDPNENSGGFLNATGAIKLQGMDIEYLLSQRRVRGER